MKKKLIIMMVVIGMLVYSIVLGFSDSGINSMAQKSKTALHSQAQSHLPGQKEDKALLLIQDFIKESESSKPNFKRLLALIDQMGKVFLWEHRDPEALIQAFSPLLTKLNLSRAEDDELSEWIAAAQDWKTFEGIPNTAETSGELYEIGKKFYLVGMEKLNYPMDETGNPDFRTAQRYLIPLLVHYDHDPRIGEVLYMMGRIRQHLWNESIYGAENFYLKEVIRRFPHTSLAAKAFQALNDNVHVGYSGSGGDFTPDSVLQMLKIFQSLAKPT